MEGGLTHLKQRAGEDWLIGYDSREFFNLTEKFFLDLSQQTNRETPLKIFLVEENPVRFLASFIAACAVNCHVFLCNPHWVEREWQQVFDVVQPDLILGQQPHHPFLPYPSTPPHSAQAMPRYANSTQHPALIMIPTGGSSGKIRFAIHTWETLMASVRGFHHYFGEKPINSFCILPLYHVSGLMQFLRSFTTGGRIAILPFKAVVAGKGHCILNPAEFFISLVPTQLARLLTSDSAAWLSRFQTVLLGGAPAWAELLKQARRYNIPLALTYGMTETASQIVTLKPEAFQQGNNSCGQVLPHAQVSIRSFTGEILGANQIGIITIKADSLTLGYYPEVFANQPYFQPDDLGFFDDKGYLNVVGRCSNKIISGGENVFPNEVEAAIQATRLVADVCVTGIPDSQWGQVVTAVYVSLNQAVSTAVLEAALEDKLSKYKRPKYWMRVERLPRNSQGKVNYEQLQTMVSAWLESEKASLSRRV
jgi:O-succinylbenzoic acid--CoA ligase